ncbi:MAG: hypothetical protein VYE53_02015 [Planctomycetota bacterium]|nr:hypothetical protein [Planctomycetota bacterium]
MRQKHGLLDTRDDIMAFMDRLSQVLLGIQWQFALIHSFQPSFA